jgi:hypothetical protein
VRPYVSVLLFNSIACAFCVEEPGADGIPAAFHRGRPIR